MHLTGEHNNEVVCKKCYPELHTLKCGICDDEKPSSSFPTNERSQEDDLSDAAGPATPALYAARNIRIREKSSQVLHTVANAMYFCARSVEWRREEQPFLKVS